MTCNQPGPWGDAHACVLPTGHPGNHQGHDGCGWSAARRDDGEPADAPAPRETPETAVLRDRIAAALYERERPHGGLAWPAAFAADRDVFEPMADAVLAVLPAPADRAAVLWEIADFLCGLRLTGTAIGAEELEAELRRRAVEAQQPEAEGR